ncbi:bis(5'-nucleosyl)-tetraphosphatase (symmetrical) [Pseudoalteromonas ulvae UL12]|uniref:bis(5'-nucleosyl)-tetraphosphatase (symmetrical) n=1 Tax=Pseudoalteromonas ulvae TaxID=107327 RepID=A0A244CQD7_PSEDV|nr:symmetrical bis(5'-nucleosyl)-tetraphosphatase [Pseudoalteromonas ulvae]MBE0365298.1 bis(5'-nucleosyl)-tetraphosphatase (symmetrical) [Pseudoalteromonas ulvae UL12]OUL57831.1 bis(5'-nucleosyl)-tetraphosphatase (symmetrical) [Pseudoalteromonas ulvae]
MADYIIGDLQGCFNEFKATLAKIQFNHKQDTLYLVGDIVARGPDSLACLRYIQAHQDCMHTVLGNHDLHLIATYLLNKQPNPKDHLEELFSAPDLAQLIRFLQSQPLAIYLERYHTLICHAGLSPEWSLQQALDANDDAQAKYQGEDAAFYLSRMYDNQSIHWHENLNELDKFKYTVNTFTRMRYLDQELNFDFASKGSPQQTPKLTPWFNVNNQQLNNKLTIVFGHWASLNGKTQSEQFQAIDTGCVWGGKLTILKLNDMQRVSIAAI